MALQGYPETPPPAYETIDTVIDSSNNVRFQIREPMSAEIAQYQDLFVGDQQNRNLPAHSISSHMCWSILNLLFSCNCFISWIPLYFSIRTIGFRATGDIQHALQASKLAREWNQVTSIVIAVSIIVLCFYLWLFLA